jgi:hypothetical protein
VRTGVARQVALRPALPTEGTLCVETFRVPDCVGAVIRRYARMSDPSPVKTAEVSDAEALGGIPSLLRRLPDEGDVMVKVGDVPLLEVELDPGSGEPPQFSFFADSVKAPDTAFYSDSPPEEKQLYDLLLGLVG